MPERPDRPEGPLTQALGSTWVEAASHLEGITGAHGGKGEAGSGGTWHDVVLCMYVVVQHLYLDPLAHCSDCHLCEHSGWCIYGDAERSPDQSVPQLLWP
jgi:hypothetical protein